MIGSAGTAYDTPDTPRAPLLFLQANRETTDRRSCVRACVRVDLTVLFTLERDLNRKVGGSGGLNGLAAASELGTDRRHRHYSADPEG